MGSQHPFSYVKGNEQDRGQRETQGGSLTVTSHAWTSPWGIFRHRQQEQVVMLAEVTHSACTVETRGLAPANQPTWAKNELQCLSASGYSRNCSLDQPGRSMWVGEPITGKLVLLIICTLWNDLALFCLLLWHVASVHLVPLPAYSYLTAYNYTILTSSTKEVLLLC